MKLDTRFDGVGAPASGEGLLHRASDVSDPRSVAERLLRVAEPASAGVDPDLG